MKLLNKPKHYSLFITTVCLISLIFNLLVFTDMYKLKYKVGKEAYNSALSIRTNNDNNNYILKRVVENKSISNDDLLKLYFNYSSMSDNISNLWYEYCYHIEEESIIKFHKSRSIDIEAGLISEVHGRIEEYIKGILDLEMKTDSYNIEIDDSNLSKFQSMYNLSTSINEIFTNNIDKKLDGCKGEERVKRLINKYYWIDILEELNKLSEEYSGIDFNIE